MKASFIYLYACQMKREECDPIFANLPKGWARTTRNTIIFHSLLECETMPLVQDILLSSPLMPFIRVFKLPPNDEFPVSRVHMYIAKHEQDLPQVNTPSSRECLYFEQLGGLHA